MAWSRAGRRASCAPRHIDCAVGAQIPIAASGGCRSQPLSIGHPGCDGWEAVTPQGAPRCTTTAAAEGNGRYKAATVAVLSANRQVVFPTMPGRSNKKGGAVRGRPNRSRPRLRRAAQDHPSCSATPHIRPSGSALSRSIEESHVCVGRDENLLGACRPPSKHHSLLPACSSGVSYSRCQTANE